MISAIERLGRFFAAEAEYLRAADWQPIVREVGKVVWSRPPNFTGRYVQRDAVAIQRMEDMRSTKTEE